MFGRTIRVVFMFVVMTFAAQRVYSDVNDLAAESLKVYKKVEAINSDMKAVTSDLDKRLKYVRYRIRRLKEPVLDDKKLKNCLNNIDRYKRWIAERKACIELAKITDANERAQLLEKYDADRKRLLAEELAAGQPVRERIDELRQEVKDKEAPFEEAMKPYCLLPSQNYPEVAITRVSAQYYKGFVRYYWLDAGNKQLADATIELKEKPTVKENAEMLDNTFYVSDHGLTHIVVWAGYFRVKFVTQKPIWGVREKIAKIIRDFIDLEGLAKIDASQNDASLNALARGSLACSKKYAARYAAIAPERREAAKELRAQRRKVKSLMSRLRKPPADSEQLTKDRQRIEHFKEEELERCQARLDIGRITDPSKRAALIAKLGAQKKKLDAEKRKIARPYKDKIKELTGGLKDKNSALNKAMKQYLLKGGNAYPGVTDISTDAKFSKATITCHWKDAKGDAVCFGELRIRDRPIIPEGARMLDGLYYIREGGEDWINMCVWAGNFHVFFQIEKKQWQGKKRVGEMVKQLVDLQGLTKINVTREVK
jgi:hypothetical protein